MRKNTVYSKQLSLNIQDLSRTFIKNSLFVSLMLINYLSMVVFNV